MIFFRLQSLGELPSQRIDWQQMGLSTNRRRGCLWKQFHCFRWRSCYGHDSMEDCFQ